MKEIYPTEKAEPSRRAGGTAAGTILPTPLLNPGFLHTFSAFPPCRGHSRRDFPLRYPTAGTLIGDFNFGKRVLLMKPAAIFISPARLCYDQMTVESNVAIPVGTLEKKAAEVC
jgi:hypothetical protein